MSKIKTLVNERELQKNEALDFKYRELKTN